MDSPKTDAKEGISARLQRATDELRQLEKLIRSASIDPRVLDDFRQALDHTRLTAWGVRSH